MTDPISFASTSPRFALPLIYAGQAQKETFINEAHSLADALLHCAIEGTATSPPTNPVDGTNWLVATTAAGDWAGQDGNIACRQAGNWLFVTPRDGLQVFNRANGQHMLFATNWKSPSLPDAPTGGSVIDAEARNALTNLISKLQTAGIFPNS